MSQVDLRLFAIYCGSYLLAVFRFQCERRARSFCKRLAAFRIHFYSVQVGAASFSMGDKRVWTTEDTENFIEAVESFPEVWDVHSRDFKDRLKKTSAFNEIASIFDTSTREVQRKWHNLKTQYSQELKKVQRVKSGSSGIVTVPRWPYFSALKFLESSVATTSERVSSLATVEEEIQVHIEEVPPSPISEASRKKRKVDKDSGLIQKAEKILGQPADGFQIFGDYVAGELRSLKKQENVTKLKVLIQKAIIEVSERDAAETPPVPVTAVVGTSAAKRFYINDTDYVEI